MASLRRPPPLAHRPLSDRTPRRTHPLEPTTRFIALHPISRRRFVWRRDSYARALDVDIGLGNGQAARVIIETCTLDTPVGPLCLIGDGQSLVAAGFAPVGVMTARLTPAQQAAARSRPDLGPLSRLVAEYLDGRLDALDEISVDQPGTPLQQEVWSGLRAIPAGQTRTYTELAAATSRPDAVRAAGTACGRNLVAPIVPCHRALRRDGSLAGYYYGLAVKRWLLDHEARASS